MSDTTMSGAAMSETSDKTSSADTNSAVRPVPFRGGGFVYKTIHAAGPLVFFVLIAIWEIGCRMGWISPFVLPAPSEAWATFMDLVHSGLLWKHLSTSLGRLIVGWTADTALGIVAGLAIDLSSVARSGLQPLVSALFPVPKIALLPLFVIWVGIDEGSKVATILFGTFFPTVISTYSGVDNIDRTLIRMGQSFGLS